MVTEQPTSKEIQSTFINVQPLQMSVDFLRELFPKRLKTLDSIKKDDQVLPLWLKSINSVSTVYDNLIRLNLDTVPKEKLIKDLNDKPFKTAKSNLNLSEYFLEEQLDYYLLYDIHAMYFILVIELPFEFSLQKYQELIEVDHIAPSDGINDCDFYNYIRNLMVKETDNVEVSNWMKQLTETSIHRATDFVKEIYNVETKENSIYIENNTGNIIHFLKSNISLKKDDIITEKTIKLNREADRIVYETPLLEPVKNVYISFNGRFHTVISSNDNIIKRFFPIFFHLQYLYVYLHQLYKLMDNLNREIITRRTKKIILKQYSILDDVINKVQLVSVFNENFKRTIEIDTQTIYENVEKYWNIERFLKGTEAYTDNFKDFLNRKYMKQSSKNYERQSNILFVISILQLVSLVGVWHAYLQIIDPGFINSSEVDLVFFDDMDKLMTFNAYLPFVLLGVSFLLFLVAFLHKQRD